MGRSRGEGGAVAVEAAIITAIAVPFLFFSIYFFGTWGFSTAQVSAAAKDGVRKAVLAPGNQTMIENAVANRLGVVPDSVTVVTTCERRPQDDFDKDYAPATCSNSLPRGLSRVTVRVEWDAELSAPVAEIFGPSTPTVSGSATRDVIGLPQ